MVADLLSNTSASATPHLFELDPPLCVADEPFVRFSVTATAGKSIPQLAHGSTLSNLRRVDKRRVLGEFYLLQYRLRLVASFYRLRSALLE